MKALQFEGRGLEVVDIPVPTPARDGVIVEVRAAGLCHSDLTVMNRRIEELGFDLPLVLGHEIAGVVRAVGADVTGLVEGEGVVVYGPWGCGICRACLEGAENLCPRARAAGILPPGLGSPGGLAEAVHVPHSRHLVPTGDLDPVQAAPLSDAGLTSYHAIRLATPALSKGGVAVVIGVGGLGHLMLQLLGTLADCTVLAVDTSPSARALAAQVGADVVVDPQVDAVEEQVRELTAGFGADVVFDLVASDGTLASGAGMLRPGGELVVVGVGSGSLPVAVGRIPLGCTVRTTYWGTLGDLREVVALARAGVVTSTVETFTLDEAVSAYERLERGDISGRAVVIPNTTDTANRS
jgi:propanol-preferring alcohol dehydrogenase